MVNPDMATQSADTYLDRFVDIKTIIDRALEYITQQDCEPGKHGLAFKSILSHFRLPGYRNPLKAPTSVLSAHLKKRKLSPPLKQSILLCWIESQNILDSFKVAAQEQGYLIDENRIDIETNADAKLVQFLVESLDERQENLTSEEKQLAAILTASGATSLSDAEIPDDLSSSFGEIIKLISSYPPGDPIWNNLENLFDEIKVLADIKSKENEYAKKRKNLEQCLDTISNNYGASIAYCGLESISSLEASECLDESLEKLIHFCGTFESALKTFSSPTPNFTSIIEEQEYQKQRITAAEEIKSVFLNIKDAITKDKKAKKIESNSSIENININIQSNDEDIQDFNKPTVEILDSTETHKSENNTSDYADDEEMTINPSLHDPEQLDTQSEDLREEEESASLIKENESSTNDPIRHVDPPRPSQEAEPYPLKVKQMECKALNELSDSSLVDASSINNHIFRLVESGNLSLAYHLSLYLEEIHGSGGSEVPSCVLHAVMTSYQLVNSSNEIVLELQNDAESLTYQYYAGSQDNSIKLSKGLMIFAACLCPSLFSPASNMHDIIRQMPYPENMSELLYPLRNTILEGLQHGVVLSPSLLKGIHEQKAWEGAVCAQQDKIGKWLSDNRRSNLFKGSGNAVWHKWLEADSELGLALELAAQGRTDEAERVHSISSNWSKRNFLEKQLVSTDKEVRGRKADLRPIEAKLKQRLLKSAEDAVSLLQDWVSGIQQKPGAGSGIEGSKSFQVWREKLIVELKKAEEDCKVTESACDELTTARTIFTRIISYLLDLFDPHKAIPTQYAFLGQILHAELLKVPGLKLSEEWKPIDSIIERGSRIYNALKENSLDSWSKAFERNLEKGNFLTTGQILELITLELANSDHDYDVLMLNQQRARGEQKQALKEAIQNTKNEIEQAVQIDLLTEVERFERLEIIDTMLDHLDKIEDFPVAKERLNVISNELSSLKKRKVDSVRSRLHAEIAKEALAEQYKIIENMLDQGDFLTANESIDLVKSGQNLHGTQVQRDIFNEFFPSFLEQFSKDAPRSLREVANNVKNQKSVGPLVLKDVRGAQCESASKMILAWDRIKTTRSDLKNQITLVIEQLGFELNSIEGPDKCSSSDKALWFKVSASPVLNPEELRIPPRFGSSAYGSYSILCIWDRPSEEEVIALASKKGSTNPTIVFYLGRLTVKGRRDLSIFGKKQTPNLLVLDESLLCFLCGERGVRVKAFFECTLPFTVANPYTTSAGMVPPEMFFGRKAEEQSIVALDGTNLVYGGRQLGKTALLLHVERKYHSVKEGMIVKWIDLKTEGIGYQRPAGDIWELVCLELFNLGILKKQNMLRSTIERKIEEWLDEDKTRRIILLLDEADAFLESDGRSESSHATHHENSLRSEYPNVLALKSLMDKTQKRFKFVLAGLHNVQASARYANTIFGHLGTPICIGPLLNNGEWKDALSLICDPLHMAGYRLESNTLPFRIFSHTNYYPSLIQLFCKHLINHFNDNLQKQLNPKISNVIDLQDIEDAYLSQGLRNEILRRFNLTLNLDMRFKVIALRIALEYASEEEFIPQQTRVNADWVRQEVKELWPEGFQQAVSLEDFQIMLDEMVGLGILKRHKSQNYSIRSHNLIKLLGNEEQIEASLLEAINSPVQKRFDPSSFRRGMKGHFWRRSPLTSSQETSLLQQNFSTSVVFATKLSGLDDLIPFLEELSVKIIKIKDVSSAQLFQERIGKIISSTVKDERTTLIVVNYDLPWTLEWVLKCQATLDRRFSKSISASVLFIANSEKAWNIIQDTSSTPFPNTINQFTLKPWDEQALNSWLQDEAIGPQTNDERKRLYDLTGGWSGLLSLFGRRCKDESLSWAESLSSISESITSDTSWNPINNTPSATLSCFKALADFGDSIATDDLVELVEGYDKHEIVDSLKWGDVLGFVTKEGRDRWKLTPFIANLAKG